MVEVTVINNSTPELHLNHDYLKNYGTGKTFVETGTFQGDTVQLALDNGYDKVISIELNGPLYDKCVERFKGNDKVQLMLGDSIDCLKTVILTTPEPMTFWLDAHASGPLVGGKSGGSPVLDELRIISKSPIKTHTIFIDDCRLFGSAEWSFVKFEDAIALLKEINPNYELIRLKGHIESDVLCAYAKG